MLSISNPLLIVSSFSFLVFDSKQWVHVEVWLDGACGLNILTSKNVRSKRHPQKPSAAMSGLAPLSVMVEA